MKLSPIQLVHLSFRRVFVEVDIEHMEPPTFDGFDPRGMFEGVVVKAEVNTNRIEKDDSRGIPYFLTLRVVVNNEPDQENTSQKFSPYKIDVEVGGGVIVAHGAEHLGDPQDLATINGTAMLWGAVREKVAGLTSRMMIGEALLPSVHFQDLKKESKAAEDAIEGLSSRVSTTPRRSRARKS